MSVPCAICGAATPLETHRFIEGVLGQRPVREWTVTGARYFLQKSVETITSTEHVARENYCGAQCSLVGHTR